MQARNCDDCDDDDDDDAAAADATSNKMNRVWHRTMLQLKLAWDIQPDCRNNLDSFIEQNHVNSCRGGGGRGGGGGCGFDVDVVEWTVSASRDVIGEQQRQKQDVRLAQCCDVGKETNFSVMKEALTCI